MHPLRGHCDPRGIHGGIGSLVFPAAIESGAIVIAVSGSSYTSGAANDVVISWFEINATN
jgi:hypothetical protein